MTVLVLAIAALAAVPAAAAEGEGTAGGAVAGGAAEAGPVPRDDGNRRCFFCHGREDYRERLRADGRKGLYVDGVEFSHSVHGRRKCWECHADADVVPHKVGLDRVQCVRCHFVGNTAGAPQTRRYKQYQESVHGRLAATGDGRAPLCQDCHGAHQVKPPDDPTSRVARRNIPEDCGRCHVASRKEYDAGIHGQQAEAGNLDAPVCTDCHSEHEIQRPKDPGSTVYPTHIPEACARCHEDQQVMDRYGLNVKTVRTFKSSFHGVALKFGVERVANCTSCHEHHDIYAPQDPRSTVNKENLPRTCGKPDCHPGASANFARGKIHISAHEVDAGNVYWVALAFKWLTIGVMSGLVIHIAFDLARRVIKRRRRKGAPEPHAPGGRIAELLATPIRRLDLFVRIQHFSMAVSVVLLILTGVPVKFHEADWAKDVMAVVGGLDVTGAIHRVGATILMLVAAAHLVYITLTGPGRGNFVAMVPKPRDLVDLVHNILYFLGIRSDRPRFDRFSYLEKFDYWAVYWGVVVMVLSGLVLWFETDAMRFMPKEWVDIAKEMHSDEAMLATLAIVIWHFFNVHLNPDQWPLNPVFWHGWTHLGELLHEHPLEAVAMARKGRIPRAALEDAAPHEPAARWVLDQAFPGAVPGAEGGGE
jgi:cytochrome b subunit of formate dehydrogenase